MAVESRSELPKITAESLPHLQTSNCERVKPDGVGMPELELAAWHLLARS
jgi:hypothetical protein